MSIGSFFFISGAVALGVLLGKFVFEFVKESF